MSNQLNDFQPIIDIMASDSTGDLLYSYSFGRLFLEGEGNELMLRVNEFSKTLTIARVEINNKRQGILTKILDVLVQYAKYKNYKKIVIENALTEEIKSFANNRGFQKYGRLGEMYSLSV